MFVFVVFSTVFYVCVYIIFIYIYIYIHLVCTKGAITGQMQLDQALMSYGSSYSSLSLGSHRRDTAGVLSESCALSL